RAQRSCEAAGLIERWLSTCRSGFSPTIPRSFLADVLDRQRRTRLRHPAKPDQALAFQLHAVPAHEGFLAFARRDERAVGALVDQQELVAVELDARMQPRDQVALDDDVVLFGTPDRNVGATVVDHDLLALKAYAQPARALLFASDLPE